jgi:small-conductance mechanosensitive channel
MQLTEALDRVYYHNSVSAWGIASAIALGTFVVLMLARWLLVGRLAAIAKRTTTIADDILVELATKTRPYFLATASVVIGSRWLTLPPSTDRYLATAVLIVALLQIGVWGTTGVTFTIQRQVQRRSAHADAASASTIRAIGVGVKLVLWTVLIITALARFGVNVTALVTGLGIGGVAIALAVQNVLSDVFAALAIVFDKPFDVGDAIAVDQMQGTVEHIGLKTTRIRSISGEQIVISNNELLKNRIRNYKRMFDRRVVFLLDVTYDTSPETVERIPAMVREVVTSQQPVRFDRSHFSGFTESALRVETVYFVLDPDYNRYLDIQQRINLALLRRFAAEGIRFAFPTRAIHVEASPSAGRGDGAPGRADAPEPRAAPGV